MLIPKTVLGIQNTSVHFLGNSLQSLFMGPAKTNLPQNEPLGTSLVVQWLRLCASTSWGTGLIPGWGTKIPHAERCSQKLKTKKQKNKSASLLTRYQVGQIKSFTQEFYVYSHLTQEQSVVS